jgi:hypothetical protein
MSELEEQGFDVNELIMPIFITLARLYDVQMAMLASQNETAAAKLDELHRAGQLRFSMPKFVVTESNIEK